MASYIVREEDGTSRLTLEEGGASLLTEESSSDPVTPSVTTRNTRQRHAAALFMRRNRRPRSR